MAFGAIDILLAFGVAVGLYVMISLLTKPSKKSASTKPEALMKTANTSSSTDGSSNSNSKPKIQFLFGTQSGTSENYAYDLAEEGKQFGFDCNVQSLGDYNVEDLPNEKFVVFVVATFGEGEPTDDAASFWTDYITKTNDERAPNDLAGVLYSVFALGNRQYRHFCAVGRRIDTELAAMNAERLLPCGLGDDDGTLAEDFEAWRQNFWAAARSRFLGESSAANDVTYFAPALDVTFFPRESEQATKYQGGLNRVARFFHDPAKDHKTMILPIAKSYEVRQDVSDGGSTVHMEFSLSAENQSYRTADNLGVHPRNDYKLAGKLTRRLGLNLADVFAVTNKGSRKLAMPTPCSVGDLFLYFADINSLPRHKHAAILSTYAKDQKEKDALLAFATTNKDAFTDLKYNWVELLEAFPSIDIPFAHIIELIPRLQHRFYTISSSSKVSPRQLAITVSRFTKPKPDGREHVGTCSEYICKAKVNEEEKKGDSESDKMVVFIRNSTFRLPVKAGTPIIMVGPGTGIAPFRGFVQEFRTRTGAAKYGKTVLYFGCRNATKDYIYKDELEQAKADGVLDELRVAFSRDGPNKVYVQDLLKQNAAETWALIDSGAYIYVCGGTAMGRDIRDTIVNICVEYGKMSPAAADTFVDRMARQNRYVQELWSS